MTDLTAANEMEYVRLLVNVAREADEYNQRSIERARKKIAAIRKANPQFAHVRTPA